MDNENNPIIVDLGKKKRGAIRALKRGRGRLMDDVQRTMEEVRRSLGAEAEGKEVIPVVVIYQRKKRRKGGLCGGW